MNDFAATHRRWGYKRAWARAKREGIVVGRDTFRRLWRNEGLRVHLRKAPKPRTAPHLHHLARASAPGQVWAIDFQFDSDWKGRVFKVCHVIDEFTRQHLTFRVERHMGAADVIDMRDLAVLGHGAPQVIRADNGPEVIATAVGRWASENDTLQAFIPPGQRHTPYGDKYVTVILDVTPVRDRNGHSRLLDMVSGRSKRVFKTWLASQPDTWRERIEIVAMDGFTGFKSAAAEELPDTRAVMDPFHVVHLAGDALDECRRRIQQELHHRRRLATDPLYKARGMLHTRSCLLIPRQQHQILDLFASEEHVALEVTWSAYQNIIDAYRNPTKSAEMP